MNKDLKSALIRYIYNKEPNILVTRDARLMGILNSYEPGVTPDPEDVERRYNELLEQESLNQKQSIEPKEPIMPEGQSGSNVVKTPNTLLEETRRDVMERPLDTVIPDAGEYNPATTLEEASAVFNQTPVAETITPDVPAMNKSLKKTLSNPEVPIKKINQIGYANIVLMSIIVIIIVAILCVFIFL